MSVPRCGAADGEEATVGVALRRFLPGFLRRHHPDSHTRAVLERLARCHTGAAGWSLWGCAACAASHWRPLGCGDRHCPDCQSARRRDWLETQQRSLLPVRYYHWVFTLPAVLRPLALQNQRIVYQLLFDCAAATLLQFGRERFGAELGITALLHTWGQNLMDHPHLHCLVTGGGLRTGPGGAATWVGPPQQRFLLPHKAVAAAFANRFLDGLGRAHHNGLLSLEGGLHPLAGPAWGGLMAQLRQRQWVVFAKGSAAGPESVLAYLGRYTHRVAIANARIRRIDPATVTFSYKDYRDGGALKTMTLGGEEFVHRLSLHVLPRGFTKIRHYGLLGSNRRRKMIPLAREALQNSLWHHQATGAPTPPPAWPEPECPRCGSTELGCIGRMEPSGRFVPLAAGARRARLRAGNPPRIADSS